MMPDHIGTEDTGFYIGMLRLLLPVQDSAAYMGNGYPCHHFLRKKKAALLRLI
jgi:hypothetical protein